MTAPDLGRLLTATRAFEAEAHRILARHEASKSRVILLPELFQRLARLSIAQDDLLRQAFRCAEHDLFRAAHVMAWAAFMDFVLEKLSSDGMVKLRAQYPSWQGKDIYEMAENYPERQFIEACKPLGLTSKAETRQLAGLLDTRNDCAHPGAFSPDLNMTLGYFSTLLDFVSRLQARPL